MKVTDLTDRWKVLRVDVTISRMTQEETVPVPKDIDPQTHKPRVIMQPVLYFKTKTNDEFPRGYLLSASVDIQSLKFATGARTVGELMNKRISITVGEHKGKPVLRIDPNPPKPTVEMVDPHGKWAVEYAAEFWNMELGLAAKELDKKFPTSGDVSKEEVMKIVEGVNAPA
jgi:hypothetical protein